MRPRTADYEMKPMLGDETEAQIPRASFAAWGRSFVKRDSIPSDPFWPAALAVPSGRDSPASGALLLEDGKKRQR